MKCQIGWIDSCHWDEEFDPGEVPESMRALRQYEKKLEQFIIERNYEEGKHLNVRVEFSDFDRQGGDWSVYVRFEAATLAEFSKIAQLAISLVPAGHAFDFRVGRIWISEDDFEADGTLLPETEERLAKKFGAPLARGKLTKPAKFGKKTKTLLVKEPVAFVQRPARKSDAPGGSARPASEA